MTAELKIYSDNEKFQLVYFIDVETGKILPNWLSLSFHNEDGTFIGDIWDNDVFLWKTLFPLLEKVYNDDITYKQFVKGIKSELIKNREQVIELYEMFILAKKIRRMKKFEIKISRKHTVWETTKYTVNAETEEQAKQIALEDELNAKTENDVGILNAEGQFNYDSLKFLSPQENYWLTEQESGCPGPFSYNDIKYNTVEIETEFNS